MATETNEQAGRDYSLSRSACLRAFADAAPTYEAADVVSELTSIELLSRLDIMIQQPRVILDVGSGSGRNIRPLLKRYKDATVIALEPCASLHARFRLGPLERMRWRSRLQHLAQHIESAQIDDASVDMIFANQSMQWCELRSTLKTFRRVLKPGGLLCFATLGPDSLEQLRAAWSLAGSDRGDPDRRVHRFVDMHDLGDELVRSGFSDTVMDMDYLTLTYASARAMFDELRAGGGRNVRSDRPKHLTGKALYQRFVEQLESTRNDDGRIELTVEVIYGQAWLADTTTGQPDRGAASVVVDFDES